MANGRRAPRADKILGSLEYKVMKALWKKSPSNVDQVRTLINRGRKEDLAYTTIMTVLSRLHDKRIVDRTQVGRAYEYTPRFSEPELVAHLSQAEVSDLMARYGDVVLAQFASVLENASPETRQRIADLAGGDHGAF